MQDRMKISKLVILRERCIGCRACEIACSYHHRKVFNPKISSLEIRMKGKREDIDVVVYEDFSKQNVPHIPCDRCEGEKEPLCIKYCAANAIQIMVQSKRDK